MEKYYDKPHFIVKITWGPEQFPNETQLFTCTINMEENGDSNAYTNTHFDKILNVRAHLGLFQIQFIATFCVNFVWFLTWLLSIYYVPGIIVHTQDTWVCNLYLHSIFEFICHVFLIQSLIFIQFYELFIKYLILNIKILIMKPHSYDC